MDSTPPSIPDKDPRATDGLDWGARDWPPAVAGQPQLPPPPERGPTREPPAWWLVVVGVVALAGLSAGIGAGVALLVDGDDGAGGGGAQPPGGGATTRLTVELTSAVAEVAASGRQSVVRIESTRRVRGGVQQDVGSGVVIDAAGHIVTNAHVVLDAESLRVILPDGTERPGILVGHDWPFTDVAVLQVGPGGLSPIEPGNSDALVLGETVVAIGNPLAEFDGSVSVGVISGLGRRRVFDGVRQDDLIQTDAAINHGNSGGALLNLSGQFVGMPTAIIRLTDNDQAVEGIAFAIPAGRVMMIAARIIIESGNYPRPSLGAEGVDLTAETTARFPRLATAQGALVTSVTRDGPAEAAGIAVGDVITSLAGEAVDETMPLLNVLQKWLPGETVKVVLNRNGRIIETEVRLAKRS